MKIGIIGGGVVGRATARAFIEHVDEVRVWDIVPERRTCSHELDITEWADLVFVCLPTPQKEGALECDLSYVEKFFDHLDNATRRVNYVLRSTVPIGTTRRLAERHGLPNLVHSPEFLTARCAMTDAQIPSRNIIGSMCYQRGGSLGSDECASVLWDLYNRRFSHVQIQCMTPDESEAVKLFLNGFFAVKVAYFNEINELATKLGLNWDIVLRGILSDGRVAHSHTQVPGPDGQYGFGGTCLPKDLASLVWQLQTSGCWPCVTEGARKRNIDDRWRKS